MPKRVVSIPMMYETNAAAVSLKRIKEGGFTHVRFYPEDVPRNATEVTVFPAVPVILLEEMSEVTEAGSLHEKVWLVHVSRLLEGMVERPPSCSPSPSRRLSNLVIEEADPEPEPQPMLSTLLEVPKGQGPVRCGAWSTVSLVRLLLKVKQHHREKPARCVELVSEWMRERQCDWSEALRELVVRWGEEPKWLRWLLDSLEILVTVLCSEWRTDEGCLDHCLEVEKGLRVASADPPEPMFMWGAMRLKIRVSSSPDTAYYLGARQRDGFFYLSREQVLHLRIPRMYLRRMRRWIFEEGAGLADLLLPPFPSPPVDEASHLHRGGLVRALGLYVMLGSRAQRSASMRTVQQKRRHIRIEYDHPTSSMGGGGGGFDVSQLPACFRDFTQDKLRNGDRFHVFGALYRMGFSLEEIQQYARSAIPGADYGRDVVYVLRNLEANPEKEWGALCMTSFMPNNRSERSFLCPFFTRNLQDIEHAPTARFRALDACQLDLTTTHHIPNPPPIRAPLDYTVAVAESNTH